MSRFFGIGKVVCLTKRSQKRSEDIIKAGERALIEVYGGKVSDSLEALRYRRFCKKTAKSTTAVEVKSLPPTSSTAKFHFLRLY